MGEAELGAHGGDADGRKSAGGDQRACTTRLDTTYLSSGL
jgi:hypothetical protein